MFDVEIRIRFRCATPRHARCKGQGLRMELNFPAAESHLYENGNINSKEPQPVSAVLCLYSAIDIIYSAISIS